MKEHGPRHPDLEGAHHGDAFIRFEKDGVLSWSTVPIRPLKPLITHEPIVALELNTIVLPPFTGIILASDEDRILCKHWTRQGEGSKKRVHRFSVTVGGDPITVQDYETKEELFVFEGGEEYTFTTSGEVSTVAGYTFSYKVLRP